MGPHWEAMVSTESPVSEEVLYIMEMLEKR
jgi:hypothetical protein